MDAAAFQESLVRRLKVSLFGIVGIYATGTIFYWLVEGMTLLEALFFTGITITTVGYGVPKELSSHGKVFTLLLILAGLSFVLYSVSYVTALLVEGDFAKLLSERRKQRTVSKMRDHVIVVGVGNIGSQVISQLLRYEEEIVAVDKEITEEQLRERVPNLTDKVVFISGDATREETLVRAGISTARALITTLPNDALNVFVTLTAKNLNPNVFVISNIANMANLTKIVYAGVDHPVATAEIAGIKIVEALLGKKRKESLIDVLSIRDRKFRVEVIGVQGTKLVGKRVEELRLKEEYHVFIVAIIKESEILLGPSKDYRIEQDDHLVVFGDERGIERLRGELL